MPYFNRNPRPIVEQCRGVVCKTLHRLSLKATDNSLASVPRTQCHCLPSVESTKSTYCSQLTQLCLFLGLAASSLIECVYNRGC